jgi:hypothetical protein
MFESIDYATIDGVHNEQWKKFVASWKNQREETMDNELKAFFNCRFGENCWTNSFVKPRGEILEYRQVDKTEFVFDGVIVFSLHVKFDEVQPVIEIERFYIKE